MKTYTNISQSQKLAEIISLDSADGYWFKGFPAQPYMVYTKGTPNPGEHIPCWSLAALLDVLPKEINALGTVYSINIHTKNEKWFIDYKCNNEEFVGVYSNIFLDTCYDIILKLHELKML